MKGYNKSLRKYFVQYNYRVIVQNGFKADAVYVNWQRELFMINFFANTIQWLYSAIKQQWVSHLDPITMQMIWRGRRKKVLGPTVIIVIFQKYRELYNNEPVTHKRQNCQNYSLRVRNLSMVVPVTEKKSEKNLSNLLRGPRVPECM